MTVGNRNHTPAKKFSLVPLSQATKTISKFTTPEAQRRKTKVDYSHWEVFPTSSPPSSPKAARRPHQQQQRAHSSSCGSEPKWRSTPRQWSARDRSRSVSATDRQKTTELFARQVAKSSSSPVANHTYHQRKLDFKLHLDVPEFKPKPKPKPAVDAVTKAAKPCLAPFNPEGGKLKDYAAYFFSQAYGLADHEARPHCDVIRDAHALTACSVRAIHEVLYGFSYDDVLGSLRAQVQVYPAKVPNRERDMDLNRSILTNHADALRAAAAEAKKSQGKSPYVVTDADAGEEQHAAAPSPVWQHAKTFAAIAAPAALLLSPFIF